MFTQSRRIDAIANTLHSIDNAPSRRIDASAGIHTQETHAPERGGSTEASCLMWSAVWCGALPHQTLPHVCCGALFDAVKRALCSFDVPHSSEADRRRECPRKSTDASVRACMHLLRQGGSARACSRRRWRAQSTRIYDARAHVDPPTLAFTSFHRRKSPILDT
jgi:hypothetical protein